MKEKKSDLINEREKCYSLTYKSIEDRIIVVRGKSVMLDTDVALLYGVETRRINEAVKNNKDKFPADSDGKPNGDCSIGAGSAEGHEVRHKPLCGGRREQRTEGSCGAERGRQESTYHRHNSSVRLLQCCVFRLILP